MRVLVCNAATDADDVGPVRVTVLWLGTVVALAGGHALARSEATAEIVPMLVMLAWSVGALAAVATIRRVPPPVHGGPRFATVIALLALALARGLGAGPVAGVPVASGEVDWPATRGDHGSVIHFDVRDASWSGARCSVLASPQGSDRTAWLELPADRCPLSWGDGIVVPARSLRPSAGSAWPGAADPRQQASSRGASWVLAAERAWPSARAPGSWRATWSRWVASARALVARQPATTAARWWSRACSACARHCRRRDVARSRSRARTPGRRERHAGHARRVGRLPRGVACQRRVRAGAPGLAAAIALAPVAAYVALVGAEHRRCARRCW
ncbi:MAG: hypothetical protein U0168_02345 [Nannocystaceae bacterium]